MSTFIRRRRHSWPFYSQNPIKAHLQKATCSDGLQNYTFNKDPFHQRFSWGLDPFQAPDEDDFDSAGIPSPHWSRSRSWTQCHDPRNATFRDDQNFHGRSATDSTSTSVLLRHLIQQTEKMQPWLRNTESNQILVTLVEPFPLLDDASYDPDAEAQETCYWDRGARFARRSHSDQPRCWRAPSLELWPVIEE